MTLKWRPGTQNQLSDVISRLTCSRASDEDVDDSIPGNGSNRSVYRGPKWTILNGISLET